MDLRLDGAAGELAGHTFIEALAEGLDVRPRYCQARGRVVSAASHEQVAAVIEGGDEGDAVHAAPAAFADAVFINGDDENGPVKFPHEPRGHDADHAGMPVWRSEHETTGIAVSGESNGHFLRILLHGVLHILTLAIVPVQRLRQLQRFAAGFGQEEVQGSLGSVETARGIEPGSEAESEVHAVYRRGDTGDFDERAEALAARVFHHLETLAHEHAVLVHQRHNVRDGGQRDEVQVVLQFKALGLAALAHRVADLEDHARAAQIMEGVTQLRIHHRARRQARGVGLVVIHHYHFDALLQQPLALHTGRSAAVHGHEQIHRPLAQTTLQPLAGEAVALLHAQRQKAPRLQAIADKNGAQQRERGYAIHIVVAKKHHPLLQVHRFQQARHRRLHVRQQKRIAQFLEFRMEKFVHALGAPGIALGEQLLHQRREFGTGVCLHAPERLIGDRPQNPPRCRKGEHGKHCPYTILGGGKRNEAAPRRVPPRQTRAG